MTQIDSFVKISDTYVQLKPPGPGPGHLIADSVDYFLSGKALAGYHR
jgi:hypothetical protein